MFVYEEQKACVSWGGVRSSTFSITNGTRQGSVLSPCMFSVYLDDLLKRLRHLGFGCHMGGMWVGAAERDEYSNIFEYSNISLRICDI